MTAGASALGSQLARALVQAAVLLGRQAAVRGAYCAPLAVLRCRGLLLRPPAARGPLGVAVGLCLRLRKPLELLHGNRIPRRAQEAAATARTTTSSPPATRSATASTRSATSSRTSTSRASRATASRSRRSPQRLDGVQLVYLDDAYDIAVVKVEAAAGLNDRQPAHRR